MYTNWVVSSGNDVLHQIPGLLSLYSYINSNYDDVMIHFCIRLFAPV
jgi:hypothetical protein